MVEISTENHKARFVIKPVVQHKQRQCRHRLQTQWQPQDLISIWKYGIKRISNLT